LTILRQLFIQSNRVKLFKEDFRSKEPSLLLGLKREKAEVTMTRWAYSSGWPTEGATLPTKKKHHSNVSVIPSMKITPSLNFLYDCT